MTLTATQIRYLVAIHSMNLDGLVHSASIADHLGVTKPTVHSMLIQLAKLKLIKKEKYSVIELTEYGSKTAVAYADRFLCINILLNTHLELSSKAAEEGALAILSCFDADTLSNQQADKLSSKF